MNQMNKPSTLILTMPALLVRAHKTDTNAWYPVAASQPRASTVHGRRRGKAHHRRRGEESTEIPGRDGQMQSGKQWQMEARNGSTPQTTTTA